MRYMWFPCSVGCSVNKIDDVGFGLMESKL